LSIKEQTREIHATVSKKPQMRVNVKRFPGSGEKIRNWRTREDPFADEWATIKRQLEDSPGLDAKTIFQALRREHPGRFNDGQLRSLQRKVRQWRGVAGPAKEVFFAQQHHPGELGESDFTHMSELNVTIHGEPFPHMIYHFVLTYSNWESGTVCASESFAALSEGLENALWELGGVPQLHQTDRMSAAVNNLTEDAEFQNSYQALLRHYGMEGRKIHTRRPQENGDVEQSHYRFKRSLDQSLRLRGDRDFPSLESYQAFLAKLFHQLNCARQSQVAEEMELLRPLPDRRFGCAKQMRVKVGAGSLISVERHSYSVNSRLVGEEVEVRLFANHLEVWYGGHKVDQMERLRGQQKSSVNYRHIVDWLVRKPGAFANYRYRDQLFPTLNFRRVYDFLREVMPRRCDLRYLEILHLAAKENEALVDDALRLLLATNIGRKTLREKQPFEDFVRRSEQPPQIPDVYIAEVDLSNFDRLLSDSTTGRLKVLG
jgi:hypothetical protein